ncbi:hypothetical protein OSTOST_12328 [Ostertagia ostertagi]
MGAPLQNPMEAPFRWWVRSKLLVVDRLPVTPSPGLPTADGKAEYHNPLRFPKTKSVRPGPAEQRTLPGEFHHSISENYYYNRDNGCKTTRCSSSEQRTILRILVHQRLHRVLDMSGSEHVMKSFRHKEKTQICLAWNVSIDSQPANKSIQM